MWRYYVVLLLVAGVSCNAWSQNVVFTAQASADRMGMKDAIKVEFTITDAQNLRNYTPPNMPDFNVVQGPFQATSSNTSIIGNRVTTSQSLTITFVITPKKEGVLSISPMVATDAAGHNFQSNPLSITVVAGSLRPQQQARRQASPFGDDEDPFAMAQRMHQQMMQQFQPRPAPGQGQPQQQQPQQKPEPETPVDQEQIKKDLFIRVVADKSKVKVGEQVTISYKLYSRIPMQVGISKLPSLNGFWTQDFELPKNARPTEEVLNGKKYQVFVLKKSALFPQQEGLLELDKAEADGMARIVQQVKRRMSDMFADPFGAGSLMMNDPFFNNAVFNTLAYRDVKVHIESTPIKISVEAVPDKEKPLSYGGAVGKFTIAGKIDKKEFTTDDVANLTLTINGAGNLKLIEAPRLELPNGISAYDPQITDTVTGRSTTISGSKILNYVLSAQTPGDYTVPAVAFSYYDPATGKYYTQHTEEFKVHVKPGKGGHAALASNGKNSGYKDLNDISKAPLPGLIFSSAPLVQTPGYWSMYALPLLGLLGMVVWKRRDEELSKDVVGMKRRRANKVALQRLITARKLLNQQDKKPFYEEVSKAIWLYLSDKLNIPLSSLSRDAANEAMSARNVPVDVQKSVENVIWECETALYASGGSKQMANTYEEAIKVISDLEDVFKS